MPTTRCSSSIAKVTFEWKQLRLRGEGTGRTDGASLVADVRWTSTERHCSATMRLHGAPANENRASVGELSYVDACTDDSTKPGTFAAWKEARRETRLERGR